MQDRLADIEGRGATLIVVSADEPAAFDPVRERMGLSYRFISDPDLSIAQKFGVRQREEELALPAVFVIDAEGIVRYVRVGETPVDRPDLAEVVAAISNPGAPVSGRLPTSRLSPGRSAAALAVAPDSSESLRLFPALIGSAAPGWVKAGTRVTYATSETPIDDPATSVRLDAEGEWVGADGARAAGAASVRGYSQVNVVALTEANSVLSVARWRLSPGADPAYLGRDAIVGLPGAGGDTWMNPAILRTATQAALEGVRVSRRAFVSSAKRYDAMWIATGSEADGRLSIYDVESGVRLHQASMTTTVATPNAPKRVFMTSTLVEVRDAAPPWSGELPPPWIYLIQEINHSGVETASLVSEAIAPSPPIVRSLHQSIDARGRGWLRMRANAKTPGRADDPNAPWGSVHTSGPAQYLGFYVPPRGLAALQPGQVLDRDPVTKFVVTVGTATRVDDRDIVSIVGESPTLRIEAAYERISGMRIHVTVDDRARNVKRDWRFGT